MTTYSPDTITAIATASGKGSVGIVRLSGPDSLKIAKKLIKIELKPRHAHHTEIFDQTKTKIDEGLVIYFKAPYSFTGECVVEFQCHGSPVVLDLLVEAAVFFGARVAKPGEFSERAFLNGRIDLTQAEAIADLIDSTTKAGALAANRSLSGDFGRAVDALIEDLIYLRKYIEAAIDFSEEEIDFLADQAVKARMDNLINALCNVVQTASAGAILNQGKSIALIGRPNAGKSTLTNALAKQDVAIVTDVPGTTRDVIRTKISLDGLPVELVDTAGLRETECVVEKIGVERTQTEMTQADAVLWLIERAQSETEMLSDYKAWSLENCKSPLIIVQTKADLLTQKPNHLGEIFNNRSEDKSAFLEQLRNDDVPYLGMVTLSAETGDGISIFCQSLKQALIGETHTENNWSARRRHVEALKAAQLSASAARNELVNGMPELAAEALRSAQQSLEVITGRYYPDDLLGEIFSSFCVGK